MKRLSTALLIASLSSMSAGALAAGVSVVPQAAPESDPFHSTRTYMDKRSESARIQPTREGPSSAHESYPVTPKTTYMLRHLSDIEAQRGSPFPSRGGPIDD
jgi:hypothetical protein